MANLTLSLTTDESSTVLSDITEITLNGFAFGPFGYIPASIVLASSQFDNVQVASNVLFDTLDGSMHGITVNGGSLDATGWTFSNSGQFLVSLNGGASADMIKGSGANDTIDGGAGGDALDGGGGVNTLSYQLSGSGVTVDLATGAVSRGDAAGDTVVNFQNLSGSNFRDVLTGTNADNVITGGAGNDTIAGGAGGDTLMGGGDPGDTLSYASSAAGVTIDLSTDTATGGDAANDSFSGFANVTGSNKLDSLTGDGNANALHGNGGNDTLVGNAGADSLFGGIGNDVLNGGTENDRLQGDAGNDQLIGGSGDDTLLGNDGTDRLVGGAGADKMTGGAGSDTFVFQNLTDSGIGLARDLITDFHQGQDKINLSAIDAIVGGGDDAFSFIGSQTFSGTDGELRYSHVVSVSGSQTIINMDTDGDGTSNAQIALTGLYTLTAADFVL